ncbi:MAG TPA: dihydrolipoyl dehydrogenase, partial [Gammaproteobacteria bacterium]|nr:dihydrolipoyl dehydrogenase [Gammaproteobacteria bacterium]
MSTVTIAVPDIGDFDAVEIIDVLVAIGDTVTVNQDILTLESDKAAMEIPSTHAGTVTSMAVAVGDKVKQGDVILTLSLTEENTEQVAATEKNTAVDLADDKIIQTQTLVLGSGPGGYTAAFRAADLGQKVTMIERHANIGGVCLNVGCIPSKALLHTAQILNETKEMADHGVSFGQPKIDIKQLATWKEGVIRQLTGGLSALAKKRQVDIVQGEAQFVDDKTMQVETTAGRVIIHFEQCIIAAGSRVTEIPVFPHD